ncbi:hypothetical protein ACIQCM_02475 [Pseudarthrobacter sp. NPDC092439]|uniref:hypothetical protein n=1 Tax=unclassified Pseudarthrobacter TaxID=2647000 RepID=UPI003820DB24
MPYEEEAAAYPGPEEVIVSIQDTRSEDAVAGHLAWGELLSPQLVAVRGSTGWTTDGLARFEVLLAAPEHIPLDAAAIERIKPRRIEVIPPAADGTERGALVWLAQLSGLPAPYPETLGPADAPGGTAEGLEVQGPPEWDPGAVLGPVAAREEALRQGLVRPSAGSGDEEFRMWWCFIFGGC